MKKEKRGKSSDEEREEREILRWRNRGGGNPQMGKEKRGKSLDEEREEREILRWGKRRE